MVLKAHIPVDAEYEPVRKETEREAPEDAAPSADPNAELLNDFEFKRLAAIYRLLRPYGYTVRLVSLQERSNGSAFQDAA